MLYFDKKTISVFCVYLLTGALALVLYSFFISSVLLGMAFILSLFCFNKKHISRDSIKLLLVLVIPFFIFTISSLFSVYQENAIAMVTKRIPIILVPITIVIIGRIKKREFVNSIVLFGLACCGVSLHGICNGILFYARTGIFFQSDYLSSLFLVQHVYISTFIVFVLLATLFIWKSLNRNKKTLLIVINAINMVAFILLSSKISLIIILGIAIFHLLYSRKNWKLWLYFSLAVGLILIAVRFFNPYWQRIDKLFHGDDPRIEIWPCAWQTIKNKSFIGFVPLGDFQEKLNYCYYEETKKLYLERYSTHSQYLEFWLILGISGLIGYIFSLIYLFRYAIKTKRRLLQQVIVMLMIFGVTECILSRQYGIMFYAVTLGFLVFSGDFLQDSTEGLTSKK